MNNVPGSVCVFCGSTPGSDRRFADAAQRLGSLLAEQGVTLVYGGGSMGLMGIVADAALARSGKVIGVIPRALVDKEKAHPRLTELRVVKTMHERKAAMADVSDGFVAMPGGFGTLDELFEALSWSQLGIHAKPCGVLNVAGYFDHLLKFLDHATENGLLRPASRAMVLVERDETAMLAAMGRYQPAKVARWVAANER